jgi:hypothetical protein
MKKIFVAMLALAAATACSNDELVSVNQEAIGFDNAFINNSVRSVNDPSLTATTLNDFQVYGYVENTPLFNAKNIGVTVYKDGGNLSADKYAGQTKTNWKYEGTQYWIAGANYAFHAVAPMTNGDWTKEPATDVANTVINFTNDGETDLLYAYAVATGQVRDNQPIEFDFKHILSKIKISFENAYNASTATIKITDVKITNAHATGIATLNKTATTWDLAGVNTNKEIVFGAATEPEANYENAYAFGTVYEAANERFVIPSAEYEFEISFVANLYINGVQIDVNKEADGVNGYNHTAKAKFAPQPGKSYDIKAVINAENIDPENAQEAIEFTVKTLPGWGETIPVDDEQVNVM